MKKIFIVLIAGGLCITSGLKAQTDNGVFKNKRAIQESVSNTRAEDKGALSIQKATKANAAELDTVHWVGEYNPAASLEKCRLYYYPLFWAKAPDDGVYSNPKLFSPFGSACNATGEVGVTVHTKNNEYAALTGIKMSEKDVVGAVVNLWRGSSTDWPKVLEEGEKIPDMPLIIKAYSHVEDQEVTRSYDEENPYNEIVLKVTYPVNLKDYVYTQTYHMPVSTPRDDDPTMPKLTYNLGGMFNKPIKAGNDFALSVSVLSQENIKYDSIWNWSIALKSATDCAALDEYVGFTLMDFTPTPGLLANFGALEGSEGPENFLPEGNPQLNYDNDSIIVAYALANGFDPQQNGEQRHYLPMLYPIVAPASANENATKDEYARTISISPVPATDNVTIVSIDLINRVEFYTLAGTLVQKINANTSILDVNVSNFTTGTYIAKIHTNKGVASKKLIVK